MTRHHLGREHQSDLLLETFLNSDFAQRAGKLAGKWKNTSRYSPILLKLSDKVLLNFFILPIFSAGWEAGIRSHISFRPSFAADWRWFDAGKGDRCSVSPAGLLQPSCRAKANRKRSLNGSHFSHQLVRTNAFLRFPQEKKLHFQRGNKSPR